MPHYQRDGCEVSLDIYCESPAALRAEDRPVLRTSCYRCGLPVCKACSDVRKTWFPRDRKIRICLNCIEQESCLAVDGPYVCVRRDLGSEHQDGQHVGRMMRSDEPHSWPVTGRERARWRRHQHWLEHRGEPVPAGT